MSVHTLALPLAYTGALLGVSMVVPQILRTLRRPELTGVSALSWSLTTLGCLTWLTYGLRTGKVPQVPGNVLIVAGAVAIVLLVPSSASRSRRGLALGLTATALVIVAVSIPATSVGYLAFAVGLVSAWPQVFESVAGWRRGDESGVSITTWSLKVASQVCWLSYAVLVGDVPVTIAATVALSTAIVLVSLESSRRQVGAAVPAFESA